jgi:glutathione S-transferase
MSFASTTTSTMMTSVTIPHHYGFVILSSCIGNGFILSMYLGSTVMTARKKYQVPYPHGYATPGYHKEADAFNRVQRGHYNVLETLSTFVICSLIGGLRYPLAVTAFNIVHFIGCILFQMGYSDTALDVELARYKKGGGLKWVGLFGVLYCTVAYAGKCQGWW